MLDCEIDNVMPAIRDRVKVLDAQALAILWMAGRDVAYRMAVQYYMEFPEHGGFGGCVACMVRYEPDEIFEMLLTKDGIKWDADL